MYYISKIILFITLCFFTGYTITNAQTSDSEEVVTEQTLDGQKEDKYSIRQKNSLGINIGVQGIGVDYGRKINEKISLRLRGQALPVSLDDINFSASDQDFIVDLDLEYSNIGLLFDYQPFRSSSLKLMGGASYFLGNTLSGFATVTESLYFGDDGSDPDDKGDFVFTPEDIGSLNGQFIWSDFAPYGGLGFGRTISRFGLGFAVELGAYFMGSPTIDIEATGMVEETKEEEEELENNLSEIKWLPQLNFRLSYRF